MTREELAPILLEAYQRVTDQWLLDVAAAYAAADAAAALETAASALAADAEKWGGQ